MSSCEADLSLEVQVKTKAYFRVRHFVPTSGSFLSDWGPKQCNPGVCSYVTPIMYKDPTIPEQAACFKKEAEIQDVQLVWRSTSPREMQILTSNSPSVKHFCYSQRQQHFSWCHLHVLRDLTLHMAKHREILKTSLSHVHYALKASLLAENLVIPDIISKKWMVNSKLVLSHAKRTWPVRLNWNRRTVVQVAMTIIL